MSPRIKRTDKSLPHVRSTSKRAKRIDGASVASALGAEPCMEVRHETPVPVRRSNTMYALTFDLVNDLLSQHYPGRPSITDAWGDIRRFLEAKGFTWIQRSVYFGDTSVDETGNLVMNATRFHAVIVEMVRTLPWFSHCVRDIRMLRIEENNDLGAFIRVIEHI